MNKQAIIKKYAKKFVSNGKYGPQVLSGVYYAPDGSVVMTNRHYLLRIKNAHQLQTPVILDPTDGQPIEGTYPDTNRVFPDSFRDQFSIPHNALGSIIRLVQAAADVASRGDKTYPAVRMTVDEKENLEISFMNESLSLRASLWKAAEASPSVRTINVNYLATALSVFDDTGSGVVVKLKGPFDPIVLSSDDGEIDVLILPYHDPTLRA